jgi:hypothetical protein
VGSVGYIVVGYVVVGYVVVGYVVVGYVQMFMLPGVPNGGILIDPPGMCLLVCSQHIMSVYRLMMPALSRVVSLYLTLSRDISCPNCLAGGRSLHQVPRPAQAFAHALWHRQQGSGQVHWPVGIARVVVHSSSTSTGALVCWYSTRSSAQSSTSTGALVCWCSTRSSAQSITSTGALPRRTFHAF